MFIQQQKLKKCVLIGHSMGAKAAMTVALQSPESVSALIPVDNAPLNATLKNANKILEDYEESLPIRQFLLTNLVRSDDEHKTLKFRVPLSVIGDSLDNMADFPFSESDGVQYDGPTLFGRGTKSKYATDATIPAIKRFFPNAQIADVEAGHWLISEKPEDFRQVNHHPNFRSINSIANNMI
ncbi:hypothetical protein PENFLA_c103G08307 [Penicillium flavigenum]|uniref:AB hydrolase-1 domain-containing protein n=1 Tax=Penicillium flavigenum TaxID=254877 RepID=A0A1V6S7F9_9EURO|nr:hypothetical protein PENFLA_c103G08307 [Penicillium flavigenum]